MSVLFDLVRSNYLNFWFLITYFTRLSGMYTPIHYMFAFNWCYNLVNFIYYVYFFSLLLKKISNILRSHREELLGGYLIVLGLQNTPKNTMNSFFLLTSLHFFVTMPLSMGYYGLLWCLLETKLHALILLHSKSSVSKESRISCEIHHFNPDTYFLTSCQQPSYSFNPTLLWWP